MSELKVEHFEDYFRAVHGNTPFPWQSRLLRKVHESGRWPSLLDLPTGSGKTAAIDIALFLLALEAGRSERRSPLRTVLAVDRRTIVDQAANRAWAIRGALRSATGGVLAEVRDRLASFTRGKDPLQISVLRGGIARDDAWVRTPDQPLVAVSTVDQVGSRLLFRGYGVSDSMRPIHAGLLGNDCLLLLDEVHLSVPFRDTLRALAQYRLWSERPLPDRWQVVEMSATAEAGGEPFGLEEEDRSHPVLLQRLKAPKPVTVEELKVTGAEEKKTAGFALRCAKLAATEAEAEGRTVGVVVNRVRTARCVFEHLKAIKGLDAEVHLVTGRMRPLDREALEARLTERVASNRHRNEKACATIVVATQCIEAGADFDFDSLISECASLDALRQRFGRLNRLGLRDDARGWVLARSDSLVEGRPDPIYGEALRNTFRLLRGLERPDFGITAMSSWLPPDLRELLPPRARAPVMLPAHLDFWVQTNPRPEPDPDVPLWLHGVGPTRPEVQVIWRADLTEAMLDGTSATDGLLERVGAVPPSSAEALSIPLHAARSWLSRQVEGEVADVEGAGGEEEEQEPKAGRRFVCWRGEKSEVLEAAQLRPEMTIVVPSDYGGVRWANWNPTATEPVTDLGDRAAVLKGRPKLRLRVETLRGWGPLGPLPAPLILSEEPAEDEREQISEWLKSARPAGDGHLAKVIDQLLGEMSKARGCRVLRAGALANEAGPHVTLVGRRRLKETEGQEVTTEDDAGSLTGVEVSLREHLRGVAELAAELARGCGLPTQVAEDVVLAASWHDAGKVDRRFQQILHGGSSFKVEVAAEPLAKSAIPPADTKGSKLAQRRSGYPKGSRHELMSVALMSAQEALRGQAHDWDLVLHLVGAHHGHCRPLAPAVVDTEPIEVVFEDGSTAIRRRSDHGLERLDSGIADRFWLLVRRYGWHGLAWLEAVLRLADHRRSEEEQWAEADPGVKR